MAHEVKLQWASSPVVTGYHAAEALVRKQPLADVLLAGALSEPAEALSSALAVDVRHVRRFFLHLVPLSARITGNLELARTTLTKVIQRDHADALAFKYRGLLTDVENAFRRELPRLEEQLPIRGDSLQEAWKEHGQHLMAEISRETEEGLFVEEAQVLLLHPVLGGLGGGGQAHLPYNSVRIETVPEQPAIALPEVVRLAWLLSRLNLDLPRYSDLLDFRRVERVTALAMIPIVLAAAAEAKLVAGEELGDALLAQALAAWLPPDENPPGLADKVRQWWEVYRDTRPPLGAGLGALDRLLD